MSTEPKRSAHHRERFMFISILLSAVLLSAGCAYTNSTLSSHSSRLEAYLATLHVGMTPADAERDLKGWGCVPVGSIGLAMSHRHLYVFIPDAATVDLQYDEHYRLVSWKGAEGHKSPNKALHATAAVPGS